VRVFISTCGRPAPDPKCYFAILLPAFRLAHVSAHAGAEGALLVGRLVRARSLPTSLPPSPGY
jgi:chlorite dismutase